MIVYRFRELIDYKHDKINTLPNGKITEPLRKASLVGKLIKIIPIDSVVHRNHHAINYYRHTVEEKLSLYFTLSHLQDNAS